MDAIMLRVPLLRKRDYGDVSPIKKSQQTELWARLCLSLFAYVEKKTCEFAVQAAKIANFPSAIGAGLAEMGFIFESFTSSFSTLRCSWGWGRLVTVMPLLSHMGCWQKAPVGTGKLASLLWRY
jgi:hypothetical protein